MTDTLTTRSFVRWYPSVSGARTQSPPARPPGTRQGSGARPAPGDAGSDSFTGQHDPSSPTGGGLRSFSVSFVAVRAS